MRVTRNAATTIAEATATGAHLTGPRTHIVTPSATGALDPVPRQTSDAESVILTPTRKLQRSTSAIVLYDVPFWRGHVHEIEEGDILLPCDQMRRAGDRSRSKELTTTPTQSFGCKYHPTSRSIAATNENWNSRREPRRNVHNESGLFTIDGTVGHKVNGQRLERDGKQPSKPVQERRPLRSEPTEVFEETRTPPASIVSQVQFPSKVSPIPIRQGKKLGPEGTEIMDQTTYTPPERDSMYPESN
jgi:hypothetical protein